MNRILVTGGAGFIGSHLVDRLIKEGNKVVVIDNLSTGKKENLNPVFFEGNKAGLEHRFYKRDVCNFDKIKNLFKNIDFVFHLAALPRVPLSVRDPVTTSKVNILGTINVFKAAIEAKVKRIIFISSSSVYGDQKKLPLKENMQPYPISPYALQKLVGEEFAKLFTRIYKVPIVSLRYFNVYGPRIDFSSEYSLVIGKFLELKRKGEPLTIFDDGNQTRGFCYVDDVVEGTIRAARSKKIKGGEVINIGSQRAYTVNYLARLIGGPVKYLPPRKGDVRHTQADISLAKELLDWEPKTDLEKGLEKTIKWFKNKQI